MCKKTYNRLQLRKHTYYVRVVFPKDIQKLVNRKQLCYTLNTKDYYEAIHLVRKESYKIDLLIASLRKLKMKLEQGTIVLTEAEICQFMVYRMREIDHFFSYQDVDMLDMMFEQLPLFNKSDMEAVQKHFWNGETQQVEDEEKTKDREAKIQTLFESYISSLQERKDCKVSTRRLIEEIFNTDCKLLNTERVRQAKEKGDEYGNDAIQLVAQLVQLDEYAKKRCDKVLKGKDKQGFGYSLFTDGLLNASRKIDEAEMLSIPQTYTKWEDVFADMIRPDKNAGVVKKTTFEEKRQCIKMIMALIGKEYVEQITSDDCESINKLIYCIPKNINKRFPNKKLYEVLVDEEDRENGLSVSSISKYLNIFKQFLKFCRKKRMLDEDLADIIDTPKKIKGKNNYQPFTDDDLEKIFNPITYWKYTKNGKDLPKFFITLVALFSGARINEICQIRLEDIKEEDGITYIQTEDKHPLQSLKNPHSKRRIPIHPMLEEIGFIAYINKQKRRKEEWLFPTLLKQYNPKRKLARNVSRGFTSYLKQLGIKEKTKVFHSFRHTVRPKLRDECHLSQEYIDALCGWEGSSNAGATTYSHKEKIPMKLLYKYISRLKYPKLNASFKEIADRMKRFNRYS